MFLHTCSACHRRQLIFPSQVTAVAATADGPVASFTCWCGAEQSARYGLTSTGGDRGPSAPRAPQGHALVA